MSTSWKESSHSFTCRGKVPFGSLREAKNAAREMRRQRGEDFRAYLCRNCGSHHVGRRPKKKQDRLRQRGIAA